MMYRDIVKVSWISFKVLQTSVRKVTISSSCRRCLKARKAGYYLTWFTQRKLGVNGDKVEAKHLVSQNIILKQSFFWDTLYFLRFIAFMILNLEHFKYIRDEYMGYICSLQSLQFRCIGTIRFPFAFATSWADLFSSHQKRIQNIYPTTTDTCRI